MKEIIRLFLILVGEIKELVIIRTGPHDH